MAEKSKEKRLAKGKTKTIGRPSKYEPRFDEMLVQHMAAGNMYTGFAAECHVNVDTLYEWESRHKSFSEAKRRGTLLLERFMTDMGKMIATGQLRRLVAERPRVTADGKPVLDPNTGRVIVDKEYANTSGNAAAWIFLCKNMLKWRDRHDVAVGQSKENGPISIAVARTRELTEEERLAEIERLRQERIDCGGE